MFKNLCLDKFIISILTIGLIFIIPVFGNDTLVVNEAQDTVISSTDSLATLVTEAPFSEYPKQNFPQKLLSDNGLTFIITILFLMILIYRPVQSIETGLRNRIKNDHNLSPGQIFDMKEKLSQYAATRGVLKIIMPVVAAGYLLYVAVVGTDMQGYVIEWLNLFVRWAHAIAGIMWIGASFYFVFLENNLNRTKDVREELAGNLWAVHGGGFYFLEKYKVAPKKIPKDLHWFKYEAYFTFLTGVALLTIVYYINARAFLIDPSVADISVPMGIGIGLISIAFGWFVYDQMCKSPLINNTTLFALTGCLLFIGMAYFLSHVFNSRAAYIHIGAILGTIMAGNVYFNIIPAQKAMVRSATVGEPLDASLGKKAGQRSLHNNYFTLPVVFIMISNHFPITFGHNYNWLVLAVIAIASAGVKHYWNLAEKGIVRNKILAVSLVALFTLALVISPVFEKQINLAIPVSFEEVNKVIQDRCVQCHSANPSDDVWKSAPNGVMYDTPEQIKFASDKIMTRAVRSRTMPQGNKTNMTEEERLVLKRWILQGAKIDE